MVDNSDQAIIESAGGFANFIYEVKPIGNVERNHIGWWSLINSNIHRILQSHPLEDYARAYWDGIECDISPGHARPWEYRCREAIVVADVVNQPVMTGWSP